MRHPGNRVVRQLPRLAGPGQFPQCGVQTELEALSDAQHHRATADAMVPCNGLVTLARKRIQQQRGPYGAPFLLGSGLADRIELAQFRFSELQGIALPREGHTPLKHNRREMYWCLENGHLVKVPSPHSGTVIQRSWVGRSGPDSKARVMITGSSLFGVGCVRATGAMPAELDPLARRRCRPTGGVATTSSFMVLVFL